MKDYKFYRKNCIDENSGLKTYRNPGDKFGLRRLGKKVSEKFVSEEDKLIGLVGNPKVGKSALIEGMLPELGLTNDDEGINIRPLPIMIDFKNDIFKSHTYHLDVLFESAFYPRYMLLRAVNFALTNGKRVVIEHFDIIEDKVEIKPDLKVIINEDICIIRPDKF